MSLATFIARLRSDAMRVAEGQTSGVQEGLIASELRESYKRYKANLPESMRLVLHALLDYADDPTTESYRRLRKYVRSYL